jgi:hypothetical protein
MYSVIFKVFVSRITIILEFMYIYGLRVKKNQEVFSIKEEITWVLVV